MTTKPTQTAIAHRAALACQQAGRTRPGQTVTDQMAEIIANEYAPLLRTALVALKCQAADPSTGDICATHSVTSDYTCPACAVAKLIRAELEGTP